MPFQTAPCQLSEVVLWFFNLLTLIACYYVVILFHMFFFKVDEKTEYVCKCFRSSVWLFHQVLHQAGLLVFAVVLTLNVECGCAVIMPLVDSSDRTPDSLVCLSCLSWLFNIIYVFILLLYFTWIMLYFYSKLNPTLQWSQSAINSFPYAVLCQSFLTGMLTFQSAFSWDSTKNTCIWDDVGNVQTSAITSPRVNEAPYSEL